jgi:BMFP domain-containing protein YqiC
MKNKDKFLKLLGGLLENGILSTQDVKKQIMTDFKFKKDKLIDKLDLVSREEFNILKKIVQKQSSQINQLSKKKKIKKVKRS